MLTTPSIKIFYEAGKHVVSRHYFGKLQTIKTATT